MEDGTRQEKANDKENRKQRQAEADQHRQVEVAFLTNGGRLHTIGSLTCCRQFCGQVCNGGSSGSNGKRSLHTSEGSVRVRKGSSTHASIAHRFSPTTDG